MSASHERDAQLESALEDYLTSVDAGDEPDQTEFKTRYPAVAGELQEFFDNLRLVDTELAGEVTEQTQTAWCLPPPDVDIRMPGEKPGRTFPVFPGFKILDELEGGGQGVVYKAVQLATRRIVALKVMRHGRWASSKEIARFENEVELASRLQHANIVKVHEGGNHGGQSYFAMEFVDGVRLDQYVWDNKLSIRDTVELFLQPCDAVQYAHQHGVMHRDLKPGNILVDSAGQSRILDFGLAKPVDEHGTSIGLAITETGEFAGTYIYAAPEQVQRDPGQVDVRCDVYTLGLILYELLTKMLPYPIREGRRDEAAKYILDYPITPPRKRRKEIPDDLDTVILKAIERDQSRRYQSAGAFAEDLRNFLAGRAINAKRASRWYVFRKTLRRYRVAIIVLTAIFAALTIFAISSRRLYLQAVQANATMELRAKTARHAERFTERELEKLNWLTNLVPLLQAPNVPDWVKARFSRQATEDQEPEWRPLAEAIPEDLLEAVRDPARADHSAAMAWLQENRPALERLSGELRTKRLVVNPRQGAASGFLLFDKERDLVSAWNLRRAYIVEAEIAFRSGDYERAASTLEAARLIVMDEVDGRGRAVEATTRRLELCRCAIRALADPTCRPEVRLPVVRWLMQEPPLSDPGLFLTTNRPKNTQLLEGSVTALSGQPEGYVDLDLLRRNLKERGEEPDEIPDEDRRASRNIAPSAVIDVLDRYYAESASLARAPLRVINSRNEANRRRLMDDPAYPVARWFLCSIQARGLGRARCERKAAVLTGCVFLYHGEHGRWPERLEEAVPETHREFLIDPYTEERFGYRVVDGMPVIYSVNEDFVDNGGVHGEWGAAGTDVVLFPPQE